MSSSDSIPKAAKKGAALSGGCVARTISGACPSLPRACRRGVGMALSVAALVEARNAGYLNTTLQASAFRQSVYARIGFMPCGEFREYKLATASPLGS
jgi:hypothetical protein